MDRRIEHGQATRQQLLATAKILFVERGYEATSIELVLEHAGISRGALYHHFENKRDLYEAVLEQAEARLAQATLTAAVGIEDPLDAMKAGCGAFLALVRDPEIQRIVLTDAPAVLGWHRWREIDERHAFGILKLGLAATPAAEHMSESAQDTLAHVLLAALLELGMLIARSEEPRVAERDARATLDELFDRLLGDPTPVDVASA
jgi:AcrR family transcriptional regulator